MPKKPSDDLTPEERETATLSLPKITGEGTAQLSPLTAFGVAITGLAGAAFTGVTNTILAAAGGGTSSGSATLTVVDSRLYEIGRRWADGEPLPPNLRPDVLYELTDGAEGVAASDTLTNGAYRSAESVAVGAVQRLVERYLAETGLTAKAADRARLFIGEPDGGPLQAVVTEPDGRKTGELRPIDPAAVREAVEAYLTVGGVRQPDPQTWLHNTSWRRLWPGFLIRLGFLARQEEALSRARELEEERAKREAAEAEAKREKARADAAERGSRTLLPRALHDQWRRVDRAGQLEQMDKGMVLPGSQYARATLARAVVDQVNAREFADLTVPQVRALVGVGALLTDAGDVDDGQRFVETLTVQAREAYAAAGVNHRQAKQCRDFLHAMTDLADRRVFLSLKTTDLESQKEALVIAERPIFDLVLHFADDDPELLDQWAAWRKKRDKARPWTGPLPTAYTLTFPNLLRQARSPLVIARDTLARLEAGAKEVRGGSGKLTSLDWALFMELTFTRQARQHDAFPVPDGPPVQSFRCHVKRKQFLEDYLGKGRFKKEPGRCVEYYLTSAKVLEVGGLVIHTELAQATTKGVRDVFVPNPDVLLGLANRAQQALEIKETTTVERAAVTKRRARKRANQGTGKGLT